MSLGKKSVVIIGAGPAGLTAAFELLSKQPDRFNVTVLEASNCIGGISKTVNHNGNRMDIGGHRFYSDIPGINEWWQKFMPAQGSPCFDDVELERSVSLSPDGPDPSLVDEVMLIRNRVSRIFFDGKFYDYPINFSFKLLKNFGFLNTIQVIFSYLLSCVRKLPEDNLENFYINRFGKKLYQMFFEDYTETVWGKHPSKIDSSWGAQRVKGVSIWLLIKGIITKVFNKKTSQKEASLIDEFKYPKLGPGQLWEKVAKDFIELGGEILMESPVVKINQKNGLIDKVFYNNNGKETCLSCDYLISSMPIKDLICGLNDADKEVSEIARGLMYRDYITLGVLVPNLCLTNETSLKTISDIVPDCWIYMQDRSVKMGRIQVYNNWSPYLVKDVRNTVWLGLEYFVNENDKLWNMSPQDFANFAIQELIKTGFINSSEVVLDWHQEKVKKAYPAYFGTYDKIDTVKEYLSTITNLYCVGRNGQHRYNNLDLSMYSAILASEEIIDDRQQDMNWL